MDPHTTPDLAADVVAWHNRHPLAKRLRASQVLGIGVVALPFCSPDAAPLTNRADAVFPAPLPFNGVADQPIAAPRLGRAVPGVAKFVQILGACQALWASGWTRALGPLAARWPSRWRRQSAQAGSSPRPTVTGLRPSFSEAVIAPLSAGEVADFALSHGSATRPGAPEWPQRDVLPDAGTPATVPVVRFVHSAAIDIGGARSRLLIGVGRHPQVIGQRLWSRPRLLGLAGGSALSLLLGLVAVIKPALPVSHDGTELAAAAVASAASQASAPVSEPVDTVSVSASSPAPNASGQAVVTVAADAASAAGLALSAASSPAASASGPPTVAGSASAARTEGEAQAIRPQLSPQERQAAREQSSELRQGKTAKLPGAAAPDGERHVYAVATLPTRSRASSQLRLVLMGAPTEAVAGEAQAEVMEVSDGWRAVMWPYASRDAAEKVRDLFASRGIKAEVIEF